MRKTKIQEFAVYGREPVIRRMRDGSLVCLSLSGGETEPMNENAVMISRSADDGVTWTEPEILFSHPSRGCWSTELFTEGERPFAVMHTYNVPGHYRELQTFVSYPDESGKKWTEPVTMKGSVNGCSIRQGFRMSNGELFFPLYWQEVRSRFLWEAGERWNYGGGWKFLSGAGISSDGEHFFRHGYLEAEVSLWEPNAVELEDGHILMYMRSDRGYLYRAESFDYGRNWTQPVMSDIPNPDTKVTLVKVGRDVLMVNNFVSEVGVRQNLCIAKSRDGLNFEIIAHVEGEAERFFYPHVYVDEERRALYLAYENMKTHFLKKYAFGELGIGE